MTEDLEIRVRLDVDDSEVDPALAKVGAKAGKKLPSTKLDVDESPALRSLGTVDTKAKSLHATLSRKTAIDVDASAAKRELDVLDARVKHWHTTAGQKTAIGGGIAGGATSAASALAGAGGIGGLLSKAGPWGAVAGMAGGAIGTAAIAPAYRATIGSAINQEKLSQFTTKAYGGTGMVDAAKALGEQTGFLASDFMTAALMGKTLQQNYGLQTDQISKLVEVSADLASASPYEDVQNVAGAMERLQSAVRGEAEASERLGLTLNDTFMKNVAFNGALKDTWTTMGEAEKAQYRYKEILNQTKDVLGGAKDQTNVSSQMRQLSGEVKLLGTELGESLLPAMGGLVKVTRELVSAIPDWVPRLVGAAIVTPAKVLGDTIPKSWSDVGKLPGTLGMAPLQVTGQTAGMMGAAVWPGTAKVDVNVNVNNNNNSQIDASASAPSPY